MSYEIYQGDTGPILNVYPDAADGEALDGNWTCKLSVLNLDDTVAIAERAVTVKTVDATKFVSALTPTETGTLTADTDYIQVVEIINTTVTPPFNRERRFPLKVLVQGIP